MTETCHRCHAELPTGGNRTAYGLPPEGILFCPFCSAPQLRLPEHLMPAPAPGEATTGSAPPPSPRELDWPAALRSVGAVALVGAVLKVLSLLLPPVTLVATPWIAGCAVLATGLYVRQRPGAWMDARNGVRLGAAAGVAMVAALGLALALSGVVSRFVLHRMGGFDAQLTQQMDALRAQFAAGLAEQNQPPEVRAWALGFAGSAEVRGGLGLLYLLFSGGVVLLLALGGGAFSGALRDRRGAVRPAG